MAVVSQNYSASASVKQCLVDPDLFPPVLQLYNTCGLLHNNGKGLAP